MGENEDLTLIQVIDWRDGLSLSQGSPTEVLRKGYRVGFFSRWMSKRFPPFGKMGEMLILDTSPSSPLK